MSLLFRTDASAIQTAKTVSPIYNASSLSKVDYQVAFCVRFKVLEKLVSNHKFVLSTNVQVNVLGGKSNY